MSELHEIMRDLQLHPELRAEFRATLVRTAVARGQREILEDIVDGFVPHTVRTFSELHDHVDANMYAGLCDTYAFTMDLEGESDPFAFANEVQAELDAWLRSAPQMPAFGADVVVVRLGAAS